MWNRDGLEVGVVGARQLAHMKQVEEIVRIVGGLCGDFRRQPILEHQRFERLIQGDHALLATRLHDGEELVALAFADKVPDGGRGGHDLLGADTTLSVYAGQKRLADNAFDNRGELHAHLVLLVGREDIDYAVDAL